MVGGDTDHGGKTYTPNGVIGNQFNVTQYIPAKEDKKSRWESFWYKTLNGGANDNYGGGSGSNQNFGIISVSENDWGSTKSGTKHNAVFFEVTETGISDLTGNVREFGPLSKKGEIFKQELTELKVFLMSEKDLIPIAGKVSDAISKSFGTIDNLSDGTNHFQENIIPSYSNKKPEIPVYSNGASSSNRLSGPQGRKDGAQGKPDTAYYNKPAIQTKNKKN